MTQGQVFTNNCNRKVLFRNATDFQNILRFSQITYSTTVLIRLILKTAFQPQKKGK